VFSPGCQALVRRQALFVEETGLAKVAVGRAQVADPCAVVLLRWRCRGGSLVPWWRDADGDELGPQLGDVDTQQLLATKRQEANDVEPTVG